MLECAYIHFLTHPTDTIIGNQKQSCSGRWMLRFVHFADIPVVLTSYVSHRDIPGCGRRLYRQVSADQAVKVCDICHLTSSADLTIVWYRAFPSLLRFGSWLYV